MSGNGRQPVELVILDWNGTLQDDVALYYEYSVRRIFARLGLPCPSIEEYRAEVSAADYMQFFWARGIPKAMSGDELYDIVYQDMTRDDARAPLFPDVAQMLQTIGRGRSLVRVSSMNAPNLDATVDRHGVRQHFARVYGGVRDKRAAFANACLDLCIPFERACAIGDMADDARAAHAAGIPSILCPRGHHSRARLEGVRTEIPGLVIVETLEEIPALLDAV